jgi:hypothetical protein
MIWWEGKSVQTNIGKNQTMEPLRPLLLGKDKDWKQKLQSSGEITDIFLFPSSNNVKIVSVGTQNCRATPG